MVVITSLMANHQPILPADFEGASEAAFSGCGIVIGKDRFYVVAL
jgi:hypothetical protein